MYVPAWQGLRPEHFLARRPPAALPFPLREDRAAYFYLARNAIYHLFRALELRPSDTVLVPAYHSGNEARAIEAAGGSIRYFSVRRDLEPDVDEILRGCRAGARVVFVIHFMGWPQPLRDVLSFCRRREIIVVEDCALALLSETEGRPLGSLGDFGVFCLYKTLPVPNGAVLTQNGTPLKALEGLTLGPTDRAATLARTAQLVLESVRARWDLAGRALFAAKAGVGSALNVARVRRVAVGDMGFDVRNVGIGMAPLTMRLFDAFDYAEIRRKRRANFGMLLERLRGRVGVVREDLPDGMCPLFFPILVPDKGRAAQALRARGIRAVEFWNHGHPGATAAAFPDAQFLRDHVLELPVHQDIAPEQIDYVARVVSELDLRFPQVARARSVGNGPGRARA